MSTQTPNLWLIKQSGGERPLVRVLNDNLDKLDAAIGAVDAEQDGSLQEQVDALGVSVSPGSLTSFCSGGWYSLCGRVCFVVLADVQFPSAQGVGEFFTAGNVPAPMSDLYVSLPFPLSGAVAYVSDHGELKIAPVQAGQPAYYGSFVYFTANS